MSALKQNHLKNLSYNQKTGEQTNSSSSNLCVPNTLITSANYSQNEISNFDSSLIMPNNNTNINNNLENEANDFYQKEYDRLCSYKAFTTSDWKIHFIDYKRLMNHLESMAAIKDKSSNDLIKASELFWCILRSDIETVNAFYTNKETFFLNQFREFDFETFTLSEKMKSSQVLCLFYQLFREINKNLFSVISSDNEFLECCQNQIKFDSVLDENLKSNFENFFKLTNDLETLRTYVVFNYITIFKILEQYDKITSENKLTSFISDLLQEPFYTSRVLAQLLVRTECIAASLISQHSKIPPKKENYICLVCNELLTSPVVLSCAHRFCRDCLNAINDKRNESNIIDSTKNWSRCVVCQKQQNLNPEDHNIDGVLEHFLTSHFGKSEEKNYKKQKMDIKSKAAPTLDISFSDCAISPFDTSIPFQPVSSHKFRPDPGPYLNYQQYGIRRSFKVPKTIKNQRRFHKRNQRKSKKQQFQSDVQTTLSRTICTKHEAYAYSQADMKPASCHQCKSNKLPIHLLFCSSGKKKKGQRSCHKKFCDLCLQRYTTAEDVIQKMTEQRQFKAGSRDTFVWICPACRNICTCAGCKRKRAAQDAEAQEQRNNFYKQSNANSVNEHLLLSNSSKTRIGNLSQRLNNTVNNVQMAQYSQPIIPVSSLGYPQNTNNVLNTMSMNAATQNSDRLILNKDLNDENITETSILNDTEMMNNSDLKSHLDKSLISSNETVTKQQEKEQPNTDNYFTSVSDQTTKQDYPSETPNEFCETSNYSNIKINNNNNRSNSEVNDKNLSSPKEKQLTGEKSDEQKQILATKT